MRAQADASAHILAASPHPTPSPPSSSSFSAGPKNVAAVFLESVTGTNGILKPPKGYLEGIRELCDRHGILMVCDEVMAGFGRTGRVFGFCHAPSVVPDIVTFAKAGSTERGGL